MVPIAGPRNGKNKVTPDGCLLPPAEHELLFRRRAIVENLTQSYMVVEVEIRTPVGVQLTYGVIMVEIDVPAFDAAP